MAVIDIDAGIRLAGARIVITGAAGYVATRVIALLRAVDCRIVRVDRPGAVFEPVGGPARVEDVAADIREPAVWSGLLDGTDIVIHFAAQTSVYVAAQDAAADARINVQPMLALLEACRRDGRRPAVLFSGTVTEAGLTERLPVDESVPDRPITIYDLHKLMAEQYLKHYACEGVVRGGVLRLANVYGPGPKSSSADRGVLNLMVRKALAGEPLTVYGRGEFVRDYVYVEDVARAFVLAAANIDRVNGRHFVVGSGVGHTLAQAINLVADRVAMRTGHRVPVLHVDPPASLSPIESRNFVADSSAFAQATGWRADTGLEAGIDRTIESMKDRTG